VNSENHVADAAAGFVLAGGRSSRMGRDKAFVEFEGRLLVERAIAILKGAALPVHMAGVRLESASRLEAYAPVVPDEAAGKGPLAGVCAGLRATGAEYTVFLPVDVPLLPSSLIIYLLWHARVTKVAVTLASANGDAQTFPAVLARETLPVLEQRLRRGELGCLAAFHAAAAEVGGRISVIPVERLVQSGRVAHPDALPAARWFLNVNTEAELRLALSLRQSRVS